MCFNTWERGRGRGEKKIGEETGERGKREGRERGKRGEREGRERGMESREREREERENKMRVVCYTSNVGRMEDNLV